MSNNLLTEEILMMLFENCGEDFNAWAAEYDYENMSDEDIVRVLPPSIIPWLGDVGLNQSWLHDVLNP